MAEKRLLTRREFIRLTTLAGAGAVIAACAPPIPVTPPGQAATQPPSATQAPAATLPPAATQPPSATQAPAATAAPGAAKYTQAPMLDQLVKDGKLPPVEKRLPDNPWVAPTLEQTGKHGGLLRRAYTGASDRYGPTKMIDKGLVWFDKKLVNQARLAESWTVSSDAKEWTFKLRKGTKWSDGHDFTTADIKWFYDNWLLNKTLTPAPSGAVWTTGAPPNVKVAVLTVVDAQTFKIAYDVPNPLLLLRLGRYTPVSQGLAAPGHYLTQFHMDLTTDKDALTAKVKSAGFASWDRWFLDDRSWWYANPDLPTIGAWTAQSPIGKDLFVMVRNPYFFGVDSAGNQLPYIDQINHRLYQDANVFKLWITGGEIDFQARNVSSAAADYTNFRNNETKGDYKVVKGISASHTGFQPNEATKNLKLREFFSDRNVRIALNLAINRDEINELVFAGLCVPRQYSPISVSPQYYKKAAEAYINYDPANANKMLDDAGYKKGADGFRTYKDGSPLSFTIEGIDNIGTPNEDATQRVVKFFNAVGVKCAYKYVERSLYTTHYTANDVEMSNWGGDRTVLPLAPEAIIFRGVQPDRPWAGGYGLWFLNNQDQNGIKPPDGHFITKIWDIWSQISVEPDPDKQNTLFFQLLDIWATEVPSIGVLGETPSFAIVKNGIKNFQAGFPNDDTTGDEEVYNAETYCWDDPSKHPVS